MESVSWYRDFEFVLWKFAKPQSGAAQAIVELFRMIKVWQGLGAKKKSDLNL